MSGITVWEYLLNQFMLYGYIVLKFILLHAQVNVGLLYLLTSVKDFWHLFLNFREI